MKQTNKKLIDLINDTDYYLFVTTITILKKRMDTIEPDELSTLIDLIQTFRKNLLERVHSEGVKRTFENYKN